MVNNEKGSSLLAVLLIMTVFTISGLSLIFFNINNMKQISTTGNSLRITNLAEMGVLHIKEIVSQTLEENSGKSISNMKLALKENLLALNSKEFRPVESSSLYYSFGFESEPVSQDAENNLIIHYSSFGNDDRKSKEVSGKIEIDSSIINNFDSHIPSDVEKDPEVKNGTRTFTEPVYFEKGLDGDNLNGLTDKPVMFLNGLYSTIVDQPNKTIVLVKGDAYIRDSLVLKQSGNYALICVEGTLYYFGERELTPTPDTQSITETCDCQYIANIYSGSSGSGSRFVNGGIYAKKVVRMPRETITWFSDDIKINAQYK